MNCPFKEKSECYKKVDKCALVAFLAVFAIALGLKLITLVLLIFPGDIKDNTWLVVISTVIVTLISYKYCSKKSKCGETSQPITDKPEEG
jgi:hypothetical protein